MKRQPATVRTVSKKGVVSEFEFPFPSPGFKPGYRMGMQQAIEFDRSHSLADIKAMARKAGVSLSGDKKELARKLMAKGVLI